MSAGIRTITVGIDGSRPSLDAADWAAREAQRRRLPLRLLHAGGEPVVSDRVPDVDVPAGRTRTALDRAAIQLAYVHPALDIIARRSPAPAVPALLAVAAETETLVLGSRGRTAIAGFPGGSVGPVGSVALAVAARADRPVVLVPTGELPEDERMPVIDVSPPGAPPYLPVVLGLDLDHPADELIGYAFDAAAVRSAPLHVVHVVPVVHTRIVPVPPGRAPGVPPRDAAEREHGERERGERADGEWRVLTSTLRPWRQKFPKTEVRAHVVHGHAGPHLLKASTRAGLLVVGRRAGKGPGRAAQSLIQHADCPVAVVPHG